MRRFATALLLAAVLVGAADASAPVHKVLAVEWKAGGGQLRWVSAQTLRPLGGPSVNVAGAPVSLTAVSPDGRAAALGGGEGGRVRLVDLRRLRSIALLRVGDGFVFEGSWPAADRLVLLLGGTTAQVAVVDPLARRVISLRTLPGTIVASGAADDRLLALLAPRDAIGPARLAIVDATGLVRTVALPGIRAGFAPPQTIEETGKQAVPGLAASPDGRRAAVVSTDRVVEVDLDRLKISSRRVATRMPSRAAKRVEGWNRGAVWTRGDSIAVTGWTESYVGEFRIQTPTGLSLIDVRTGAATTLDRTSTQATHVGATLVGHGGTAIRGYRLDGSLRFELADGDGDSEHLQSGGRYLYVGSANSTRFVVVDVETGRVVGRARTKKPTVILGP